MQTYRIRLNGIIKRLSTTTTYKWVVPVRMHHWIIYIYRILILWQSFAAIKQHIISLYILSLNKYCFSYMISSMLLKKKCSVFCIIILRWLFVLFLTHKCTEHACTSIYIYRDFTNFSLFCWRESLVDLFGALFPNFIVIQKSMFQKRSKNIYRPPVRRINDEILILLLFPRCF